MGKYALRYSILAYLALLLLRAGRHDRLPHVRARRVAGLGCAVAAPDATQALKLSLLITAIAVPDQRRVRCRHRHGCWPVARCQCRGWSTR